MAKRRVVTILSVTTLLAVAVVSPADAWSRRGHMVTGAMTYRVLAQIDPPALEAVVALLSEHPHFGSLLEAPDDWALDTEDRTVAVFMRAARWADDVRSGPFEQFSRSTWHYVNYFYTPPDRLTAPRERGDGDLLNALRDNYEVLQDRGATASDRAVALTWLFHLVGDAHQPLHTIALRNDTFPGGDRGGNSFTVRARPGGNTINLHAYWDDLLIGTDRFQEVRNRATELRLREEFRGDDFTEQVRDPDFSNWVRSGVDLAIEVVYRRGELRYGREDDGATLPSDYLDNARPVAERRAVLAAHRMAWLLAEAF